MFLFFYQTEMLFQQLIRSGDVSDTFLYEFYCFLPHLSRCLCVTDLATTLPS